MVFHRRRGVGRSRSGGQLGLFLLGFQILQFGLDNIPPITLATLGLNCAVYVQLIFYPQNVFPLSMACLSYVQVCYLHEWRRLFLAPWFHTSDMHLYYNMSSLLWKGRKLELRFGKITFAVIILTFAIISTVITLTVSLAASEIMDDASYLTECAAGFSGVLFALKVLLSYYDSSSGSLTRVMFFEVPTRAAFWFELVLIQLLVPNVSFCGHLAGILTGLLYVKGPLKPAVKTIVKLIESLLQLDRGSGQRYSNSDYRETSGWRDPGYGSGATGQRAYSEQDQMDWAMRDSVRAARQRHYGWQTPHGSQT